MKTRLFIMIMSIAAVIGTVSCKSEQPEYHTAAQPLFAMSADEVDKGVAVTFTDNSIPTQGTSIVAWAWDFGQSASSVSTERNPTFTYTAVGTFTVRLVVTDSNNCTAGISRTIKVNTPDYELAHAAFTASHDKVNMGVAVSFTDGSTPARDASITSWEWNFGESDTSVSTQQNPEWTYTTSGGFTVTLKVTDSKKNVSTVSHDILVMNPEDLVSVVWKKQMLGAIENTVSPAMSPDGKSVYMWADQSADNAYDVVLKAFSVEDGTEKWACDINKEYATLNAGAGVRLVYSSPAVGPDGDVYVCARDLRNSGAARRSFLLAIRPDGSKHWHYAFGIDANFNYMTPAIDAAGNIYVGHLTNSPFEIAILDPKTGAKSSSIPLTVGVRSGISLDRNGNVYFCSTGTNGLFSYSKAGAMNWQYNTNFSATGGDITLGADGTIYTVATSAKSGLVSAISPSGVTKWEYALPGTAQYGGVVLGADGTIYANAGKVSGESTAGVVALDANGQLKWHFSTDEDVNNCVPMVDNRGYVHFITDSGTYYVVTDTGLLYGKKSLGNRTFSSPVMNAAGQVCVAVQDQSVSYVIRLDTGASAPADSAWPMKGQNQCRTHLQK